MLPLDDFVRKLSYRNIVDRLNTCDVCRVLYYERFREIRSRIA